MNSSVKSQLFWVRALGFALSVSFMTWGPRLPELKDQLNLSVVQLGQIFMVVGLVGLIFSKFNSWLLINLGSRKMIFLAVPVGILGNILVATSSSVWQFAIGLGFCSLASFITNTAAITQANNIRLVSGIDPQATLAAISNIGSLAAMLLGAALLKAVAPVPYIIGLSVIASFALTMAGSKLSAVDLHEEAHAQDSSLVKMPWFGKGTGVFWVMVLTVFASTTAEFAVSDWGAILARDSFAIPGPFYLLPFVVFQAGIVTARFVTDHLGARYGIARFVRWSTCSAATVWILCLISAALLADSGPWIRLAIILIGFAAGGWGVGPIWPVFISAINKGKYPPSVVLPRFFSFVSLAFVLGPGLLGQLANWLTLPFALVVAAGMLFLAGVQSRKRILAG